MNLLKQYTMGSGEAGWQKQIEGLHRIALAIYRLYIYICIYLHVGLYRAIYGLCIYIYT